MRKIPAPEAALEHAIRLEEEAKVCRMLGDHHGAKGLMGLAQGYLEEAAEVEAKQAA